MIYTTVDGDVLDAICFKHYGESAKYTEQVLDKNPGLADLGVMYEAGVKIELPEFDEQTEDKQTIKLWD